MVGGDRAFCCGDVVLFKSGDFYVIETEDRIASE